MPVIEGARRRGAVVAAGAVVTDDVPAHAVVAGSPARLIKMKDAKRSQRRRWLMPCARSELLWLRCTYILLRLWYRARSSSPRVL